MLTVYKYPLPIGDAFTIDMPDGAEIITAQVQHGKPCIWAIVNTAAQNVTRTFRLAGTGSDLSDIIPMGRHYIGTFQLLSGGLVFHLWEITP